MTFRSIDKEVEHYKHVNQRHSKEVSELKTEIKHLKNKLATAESNVTTGATDISTTKQTGAHQGGVNNTRTTFAKTTLQDQHPMATVQSQVVENAVAQYHIRQDNVQQGILCVKVAKSKDTTQ